MPICSVVASLTKSSLKSLIPSGSKPLVGSSKISKLGLWRIAWARPNLCLMPSEYLETLSLILFSKPTNFITSSIRLESIPLYKLATNFRLSYPERYIYKSGFSTIAPTFSIAFSKFFTTLNPLISTEPLSILCNPKINLIVVVLPEPLGPIKPRISPEQISKEIPFKISFLPKCLYKFWQFKITFSIKNPPIMNIIAYNNNISQLAQLGTPLYY